MIANIDFYDNIKANKLIDIIDNQRHRVAFLIMMDCGLRVSECVNLQIKNFDFKKKNLSVQSLKKRGDVSYRTIPLSDRLYSELASYVSRIDNLNQDSYLFAHKDNQPITRKAMNRVCERLKAKHPEFSNLHPHALRHTCATRLLSSGAELHVIKEVLGHKNYDTTLIYSHIPQEILRKRIDAATLVREPFLKRSINFLLPQKKQLLININPSGNLCIGRNLEISKISELVSKNVNVLILGGVGTGKTHLIEQICTSCNRKLLRIDDFSDLKQTLANALLFLYKNDKEAVMNLIYPDYDLSQLQQHLQKDSIVNLSKELIKITQKNEYLLVIDNCDRITPKGVKLLEILKDHFVILTTARQIALDKSSFTWNFEIIRIDVLPRQYSLELIHKLSYDLDIEDYELYRNHIFEQTAGNPRAIFEIVERYRKEPIICSETIRMIRHSASLPEIDFSLIILVGLGSLAILRYLSGELDNDSLRFFGGCAMVLLIIARYFFKFSKKRFV
jgi:hypothetical protein